MNRDSFLAVVYRATPRVVAHKAHVRRRILDAARERVAEGGFSAATVAAVAGDAELATGTVYRYFPSKSDLLAEVFRLASSREVGIMREQATGPGAPVQRLRAAIASWCTRAIRGRRLAYALIAEPVAPEIEAERLEYRRAYADVLRRLVQEGIDAGVFTVRDPATTAAALVGALAEALVGPLAPDDDRLADGADAIVEALVELCLRCVGAAPAGVPPS